jgi:hypothetical protein
MDVVPITFQRPARPDQPSYEVRILAEPVDRFIPPYSMGVQNAHNPEEEYFYRWLSAFVEVEGSPARFTVTFEPDGTTRGELHGVERCTSINQALLTLRTGLHWLYQQRSKGGRQAGSKNKPNPFKEPKKFQLRQMLNEGKSVDTASGLLGISRSTAYRWRDEFLEEMSDEMN